MTTEEIAHASLIAAQDSAHWAWWTMAASVAAVFISLATLGLAFSALDSWKEQERLKIKMEFKRSILELSYCLEQMPETYWYFQVNIARERIIRYPEFANRLGDPSEIYYLKQNLKVAFAEASKAWIMCGHLFSDDIIKKLWREFNKEYREYSTRGGNKNNISNIINSLCSELKVI
ncbi:hypothetical protein [Kluyvera sp. Awk 3]|uniref:hypothetical protein n=1 Tax=Kluyvera sp. Awk 3 TaxID=2963956 RepID=UPI00230464CE|nr:hypothetical protein [Kluyvera sp. Awk 3]MDA8489615.1 hypothetical protein [Kluyvera sp. Awk 3]